ncbi:RIP metalloprotease [Henriciella sp.]|uniref:M50 family metallopeptidase n=1 Tax=Henriciella sp. TaxID=1968823 RepID=UPI002624737F|nr:M50 family metallopeptidase [Henriciella sp.]
MIDFFGQIPVFILSLVILLGIVVVIHELGHYFAGRFFGAAVESFSVGFGRPIYQRMDSRGTRWRINWIPLGGFVKFVGEGQLPGDVGKIEKGPVGKPYNEVGVGARTIVAAAGPAANFVLAILIFALIFFINGSYETRLSVTGVVEDGAAYEAGMQAGDVILSMDGKEITNPGQIQTIVAMSSNSEVHTIVERDSETVPLTLVPRPQMRENAVGQVQRMGTVGITLGVVPDSEQHVRYNPAEALVKGGEQTWSTIVMTTDVIGRMVTGKEHLSSLSGPVAIGDISRRIVNQTMAVEEVSLWEKIQSLLLNMLNICAAVSVGIGFFNLLPFPVLDGGHIVFNCYEAIAGKPMPARIQEGALMAGMVLLLGMFVFITWGDVLETGLFNGVRG